MSAEEENVFSVVQSRRFACDRCHRQKLKCERSPFIANGNIILSLGACSRCVRAEVPCQTTTAATSGDATAGNSTSIAPKRKHPETEVERGSGSSVSIDNSSLCLTGMPFGTLGDIDLRNASPTCNSSIFNTNTVSPLDQTNFDFGTRDFDNVAGRIAIPSQSQLPAGLGTPLPSTNRPPGETEDGTETGYESQFTNLSDLAYFGNSDSQQMNDNTGSTHQTLPTPVSHGQRGPSATETQAAGPNDANSGANDYRVRLLELHSLLLRELHSFTGADLIQAFFLDESMKLPSDDTQVSETNIIRRVLFASERLIELIKSLPAASSITPSSQHLLGHHRMGPESGHLSFSCAVGNESKDTNINDNSNKNSTMPNTVKTSTGAAADTRFPPPGGSQVSTLSVDLPVIISFLSCYMGVLSVYRAILTHVYEMLRCAARYTAAQAPSTSPALSHASAQPCMHHQGSRRSSSSGAPGSLLGRTSSFTGAIGDAGLGIEQLEMGERHGQDGRADGYYITLLAQLDPPVITRQRMLGIRIQLEVMTHMLDQIEDAWAGVLGEGDGMSPLLQPDGIQNAEAAELWRNHQLHEQQHQHRQQHRHRRQIQIHHSGDNIGPVIINSGTNPVYTTRREATRELLQSMLIYEGYETPEGHQRLGLGSVIAILESIRRLLRSTRFI